MTVIIDKRSDYVQFTEEENGKSISVFGKENINRHIQNNVNREETSNSVGMQQLG